MGIVKSAPSSSRIRFDSGNSSLDKEGSIDSVSRLRLILLLLLAICRRRFSSRFFSACLRS